MALYVVAIEIQVHLIPDAGPAGERLTWPERLAVLRASWRILLVAIAVSGGIYSGIFTVTEAASVGASLALIMALLAGQLTWERFVDCLLEAAGSTCMIFVILIGASIFSYFISLSGAPDALIEFIRSLGLAPLLVILLLMIMYVVLGSVFDTVAAMVITLPFVLPLVTEIGFDPVWWGVMMVMVMEVGMITPPIGINVFVLKGAAAENFEPGHHLPWCCTLRGGGSGALGGHRHLPPAGTLAARYSGLAVARLSTSQPLPAFGCARVGKQIRVILPLPGRKTGEVLFHQDPQTLAVTDILLIVDTHLGRIQPLIHRLPG